MARQGALSLCVLALLSLALVCQSNAAAWQCDTLCELITDMEKCESERGWLGDPSHGGVRSRCCDLIERDNNGNIEYSCVTNSLDSLTYEDGHLNMETSIRTKRNEYFELVKKTWDTTGSFDDVPNTKEFYKRRNVPDNMFLFTGPFAKQRSRIDYNWHAAPNSNRQLWQDQLVAKHMNKGRMCTKPWLIFTAGAMGSGKGFVQKYLNEKNILQGEKYVTIDLDAIRDSLPEFELLKNWAHNLEAKHEALKTKIEEMKARGEPTEAEEEKASKILDKRDKLLNSAGYWTHHESGLIQEVMEGIAKDNSMCALIDGSLQDKGWWGDKVFPKIRMDYPHYRILILYVWTRDVTAMKRAKERAITEGRSVPEERIRKSIEKVPLSVHYLRDLAELTIYIDNDRSAPSEPAVKEIYMNENRKLIRHARKIEIQEDHLDQDNIVANWALVDELLRWGENKNGFCDPVMTEEELDKSGLKDVCPNSEQRALVERLRHSFRDLSIPKIKMSPESQSSEASDYMPAWSLKRRLPVQRANSAPLFSHKNDFVARSTDKRLRLRSAGNSRADEISSTTSGESISDKDSDKNAFGDIPWVESKSYGDGSSESDDDYLG